MAENLSNRDRLRELLLDVFLLDEDEFDFELRREAVDTWDSLGVVSMAVGVEETFGYHMEPEEAVGIEQFEQIVALLVSKGVPFDE